MHQQWESLTSLQQMALICAKLVHDDLQNLQEEGLLPQERMREIDSVIRNSIYEALWVVVNADESEAAQEFLDYAIGEMPEEWSAPQFSAEFVRVVQQADGREPAA